MKETTRAGLDKWYSLIDHHDDKILKELLHDDVVFYSPVVFTPQKGKDITFLYLKGASHVLSNDQFTYVKKIETNEHAVLEFETEIDGVKIDGIDMITFDNEGLITEFKVMLRPLQAVRKVHEKMGEMLDLLKQMK